MGGRVQWVSGRVGEDSAKTPRRPWDTCHFSNTARPSGLEPHARSCPQRETRHGNKPQHSPDGWWVVGMGVGVVRGDQLGVMRGGWDPGRRLKVVPGG